MSNDNRKERIEEMIHLDGMIKQLCHTNRMTIPELAEKIGMSKSFYTTLKNDSLKVDTLIKIAEVFGVPISVFFNEESANWNNKDLIAENVRLDIKNQENEKKISELQNLIETLNTVINSQSSLLKHYERIQNNSIKETK